MSLAGAVLNTSHAHLHAAIVAKLQIDIHTMTLNSLQMLALNSELLNLPETSEQGA